MGKRKKKRNLLKQKKPIKPRSNSDLTHDVALFSELSITRSMPGSQKNDDASCMKTIKTFNLDGVPSWSDLIHDVLLSVMMKLSLVNYLAFRGVCKSWRSCALFNKNKFMSFKAPISICISNTANEKECCLTDFDGAEIKKTTLPHSSGRTCIGITSGYFILFDEKSNDFWLVNPVTSHELHFLVVPFENHYVLESFRSFRAIIVFSHSISEWVFVILPMFSYRIWFSIAGKRKWTYVPSPVYIRDLHSFKGKIYALHFGNHLSELRLYPAPKLILLQIENFPKQDFDHLLSLGDSLYVMDQFSENQLKIQEINLNKMECVSCDKIGEEYAIFSRELIYGAAVIQEKSWAELHSQYKRCAFINTKMWYFLHDFVNVNILNE